MTTRVQLNGFYTLLRKEVMRIFRIWVQSLLPPVVTTVLYFMIFGNMLGHRIGQFNGVNYVDFIAPGLVMLAVITNAYANTSSSFFGAKMFGPIEELLVSPMRTSVILAGYIGGGCVRGLSAGILVFITMHFFTSISIHSYGLALLVSILAALCFSLLGILNGIFARSFDEISIIPTFVLTPLIYLGGVFFPLDHLPALWQRVAYLNPIAYVIDCFRYSCLGGGNTDVTASLIFLVGLVGFIFWLCWYLMEKSNRLRQ